MINNYHDLIDQYKQGIISRDFAVDQVIARYSSIEDVKLTPTFMALVRKTVEHTFDTVDELHK